MLNILFYLNNISITKIATLINVLMANIFKFILFKFLLRTFIRLLHFFQIDKKFFINFAILITPQITMEQIVKTN